MGEQEKNFYQITEEQFQEGIIRVHYYVKKIAEQTVQKHIFVWESENEETESIVLATIDGKHDSMARNKRVLEDLIRNPQKRSFKQLGRLKKLNEEGNFQWSVEGLKIFSNPKGIVPGTIEKTVEFDPETRKMIYYGDKVLNEVIQNMSPVDYEQFEFGKEALEKVNNMNIRTLPRNYEEAIEFEESLGFSREEIVKYMRENKGLSQLYREYLNNKETSLFCERNHTVGRIQRNDDPDQKVYVSKQVWEYCKKIDQMNKYIFERCQVSNDPEEEIKLRRELKMPLDYKNIELISAYCEESKEIPEDTDVEKLGFTDEFFENVEISQEELYLKELKLLAQVADRMKTEFFHEHIQDVEFYLRVLIKDCGYSKEAVKGMYMESPIIENNANKEKENKENENEGTEK